jgi:hypothetical protein
MAQSQWSGKLPSDDDGAYRFGLREVAEVHRAIEVRHRWLLSCAGAIGLSTTVAYGRDLGDIV